MQLIKHKVKDPHGLLKTVNGLQNGEAITTDPQNDKKIEEMQEEIDYLKQQESKLMEELKVEREQRKLRDAQWRRQLMRIQEMRAFQQTVQAYTHTTASPVSIRNLNQKAGQQQNANQKQAANNNNNTASTSATSKLVQSELVPSFLKALYITREDTIFDEDCEAGMLTPGANSMVGLNLRSMTNSAEGALSAPEALKQKMAEMNRSKSAMAATSNTKSTTSANDGQANSKPLQFQRNY